MLLVLQRKFTPYSLIIFCYIISINLNILTCQIIRNLIIIRHESHWRTAKLILGQTAACLEYK